MEGEKDSKKNRRDTMLRGRKMKGERQRKWE